jgi:hypothetical protein
MRQVAGGQLRGPVGADDASREANALGLRVARLRCLLAMFHDTHLAPMWHRLERAFWLWRRVQRFFDREVVDRKQLPAADTEQSHERCKQRPRLRLEAHACVSLLLALSGCRSLVDADAYTVGQGGAGGEPAVDPLAWAPPACSSCAEQACEVPLGACSMDRDCASSSACFAEGASPAQRLRCALRYPAGQLALTGLHRCLATECTAACRGEAAWGCLNEDPRVTEPAAGPVSLSATYLNILNGSPLSELTVRVCERGTGDEICGKELASALTNDAGTATLAVADVAELERPFLNTVGEGLYPELRFHSTPILVDTAIRTSGITREAHALISTVSGTTDLQGHGALTVTLFDCVGAPASGVALEVSPTDAESRLFYSKGQLDFDAELDQTQADGIAVFANLPTGTVTVRAIHVATGQVINEQELDIVEGHRSALALEPRVER